MRRVAIISLGYLWFPCESGTSRFYQIAKTFVEAGWEVECITTSFQHFKKSKRDIELIRKQNYPFEIIFIDAPSYKKNVDIRRVFSNKIAEKHLKKYLYEHIDTYDVIYLSIPANNIAAAASSIAKKYNIPIIVDVEDLWPEAMSMVFKNQRIKDVLMHSFIVDAETTYRNASGIIGTSEDYTDRAFKNRNRDIPSETFFVGCDIAAFDAGVNEHKSEIKKPNEEYWVTYAGSISTSYDIKTLIDAGYSLRDMNVHIQILGTGSIKDDLVEYSKNMDNIHFWGFVPYPKMAAVLNVSDIVINSFIKSAPQSIVNKIGDYLASGKPMINTLQNPVFCKLVESNRVGLNTKAEDKDALREGIITLFDNKELSEEYGKNARRFAEERFDRAKIYPRIVEFVKSVINGYDKTK